MTVILYPGSSGDKKKSYIHIYITLNRPKSPNDRVRTSYYYYRQSTLKHTFLELDSPFFRHKHRATEVRTGEILLD